MNTCPLYISDLPQLEPVALSIWPRQLFHFRAGSIIAAVFEIIAFPFNDNISIALATAGGMTLMAMV